MEILKIILRCKNLYNSSGGGSYEEGENEKKIGNWIDICDNCNVIS